MRRKSKRRPIQGVIAPSPRTRSRPRKAKMLLSITTFSLRPAAFRVVDGDRRGPDNGSAAPVQELHDRHSVLGTFLRLKAGMLATLDEFERGGVFLVGKTDRQADALRFPDKLDRL